MPTDLSLLPNFRSQPVPWITRWSSELHPQRHDIVVRRREDDPEALVAKYREGPENRDKFGVLWQREGIRRGGEPQYKNVNTYRQRTCMLKGRCQVCGRVIRERPVEWLMPVDTIRWIERDGERVALTTNSPSCVECRDLALDLCPNLKANGWELYHVLDWAIWGTYGMLHFLDANDAVRRTLMWVPYDLTGVEGIIAQGSILAQQMVVQWDKFVLKEEHRPEGYFGAVN